MLGSGDDVVRKGPNLLNLFTKMLYTGFIVLDEEKLEINPFPSTEMRVAQERVKHDERRTLLSAGITAWPRKAIEQ